jgi:hypothetical protein
MTWLFFDIARYDTKSDTTLGARWRRRAPCSSSARHIGDRYGRRTVIERAGGVSVLSQAHVVAGAVVEDGTMAIPRGVARFRRRNAMGNVRPASVPVPVQLASTPIPYT